jgi:hypothetical protein
METKAKGIDPVNIQLDYIKASITSLESKILSSITGKEQGSTYKSNMLGIAGVIGDVNVPQQLIDKIAQVFSTVTITPMKPSVDEFVESDEGRKVISLLEEVGANLGPSGTEKIINDLLGKAVKALGSSNITTAMNAADNTDLEEIKNDNALFGQDMDYISSSNELSELELMSSMDPFVRMGMFYQLALLENETLMDRITPASLGTGVNYSGMLTSGKMNDESLKILFGRNIKTGSVKDILSKMDSISVDMVNLLWSGSDAEGTRRVLFIPAMQAVYIALLNYVVLKGLHSYLTKKSVIVAKARTERESEKEKKRLESTAVKTPATMTDSERGRKIQEIFKSSKINDLLNDNTIYIADRKGYEQERVKALKELVYYMFGDAKSDVQSAKNWDISKNPIDGNYDKFFSNIIKDIQKTYDIRPIDGKVGPITKDFFIEETPSAIVALI